MPDVKVKYPMWLSVSTPMSLGSTQIGRPRLIHLIGSTDDPEKALERAGEVLSAMGITEMRVHTTQVHSGLDGEAVEAVEVYDPRSFVGVVVIGLSVVDESVVGSEDEPIRGALESWWDSRPVGRA